MNTYLLIFLLALLAVGIFVLFGYLKKRKGKPVNRIPTQVPALHFKPVYVSPNGVTIYMQDVNDVPPALMRNDRGMAAIEAGITESNARARCAGFGDTVISDTGFELNVRDAYALDKANIYLFKSERSDSGVPGYRIQLLKEDPWYDTEFDKGAGKPDEKDHYMLVAGEYLWAGALKTGTSGPDIHTKFPGGQTIRDENAIAVAAPLEEDDMIYLKEAVQHEHEHILDVWLKGKVLTGLHNHPIYPPCQSQESSLVSNIEEKCDGAIILK